MSSPPFSLNPSDCTDLMLKPCVGVMCVVSSEANCLSRVVFPALSSPSRRIRSSRSGVDLSLRRMERRPILNESDDDCDTLA